MSDKKPVAPKRPLPEGAERQALVRALAKLFWQKEQEAERRARARRLG